MSAPSLTPGRTLGHFCLIEEIGAGGMGIVYRARDTRLERDVAIKVLNARTLSSDAARKRFHREALLLSRLSHPNIESVYDFRSEDGTDYLVMEYVPGDCLSDRLRQGPLSEKEILAVGIQLARGLAAAHAQRILHRDLKPSNLKMTPDKVLKILDFGLAQLLTLPDDETVTETVAVPNPAAGTPAYVSPEQLKGKEPDTRSDIYAAGVVLYELATGLRPFNEHGDALRWSVLYSMPPAPREVNKDIAPSLEGIILKCLDKDPNARYQTARDLLEDLKELARGSGRHQAAAAQPRSKPRRWLLIGLALILVFAAGFALRNRFLGQAGQPQPEPQPQPPLRQKIMAVLPIEAVGQDPATSALGLGLTETVTAKLVQASASDMIEVVSPRDLRDRGVKTAEEARREFGTDLVLEGSLQRSGQMIRINCYLVDSRTHRQIAAKSIQAKLTDPFSLQDKVVTAALDMLPTQIEPEQRRQLSVQPDTKPAAYEAYILGRGYLQEYEKPENVDSAITEFKRALQIDPNYAPAYAGLGAAYWTAYQPPMNRGKDWLTGASQNCEKALALDPQLAEAHTCLGNVDFGTGQYEEAVTQYQRALDLDPRSNDALEGLASAYGKLENPVAAEAAYKKAIVLRPEYWAVYSWLGEFYTGQARYSQAAEMYRKVTELAPDNYTGHYNLGAVYVLQGRYREAISELNRSISLRPNAIAYSNLGSAYFALKRFGDAAENFQQAAKLDSRNYISWGNLGDALYWTPGRRQEARKAYQTAISLAKAKLDVNPRDANTLAIVAVYYAMTDDKAKAQESLERALKIAPNDPDVMFRAGLVYNHFGETDRSLTWLKKAVDAGVSRSSIRDLPDFDSLKGDPKFEALTGGR